MIDVAQEVYHCHFEDLSPIQQSRLKELIARRMMLESSKES